MIEIADLIENGTRALVEEDVGPGDGRQLSGIGFPTGLSCNEVAAHYTPNAGDKKGWTTEQRSCLTPVLQRGDVMKVDFGVHVNGRIVDSAFTMNFEPTWDRLLDAVRDATETGIKVSIEGVRRVSRFRKLASTYVFATLVRLSRKSWRATKWK